MASLVYGHGHGRRRLPRADRRTFGARNAVSPRDTALPPRPARSARIHTRSRTDMLVLILIHTRSSTPNRRLRAHAQCARPSVRRGPWRARPSPRPAVYMYYLYLYISRCCAPAARVSPSRRLVVAVCVQTLYIPFALALGPPVLFHTHTRSVSHLVPSHRTGSHMLSSRLGSSFPPVFYFVLHPRTPPSTMSIPLSLSLSLSLSLLPTAYCACLNRRS